MQFVEMSTVLVMVLVLLSGLIAAGCAKPAPAPTPAPKEEVIRAGDSRAYISPGKTDYDQCQQVCDDIWTASNHFTECKRALPGETKANRLVLVPLPCAADAELGKWHPAFKPPRSDDSYIMGSITT